MKAIMKREFNSYFASPTGYAYLGICLFFSGLFFTNFVLTYGVADFTGVFSYVFIIDLFTIPILTMRLMSDEQRLKTDQLLMTAPVSSLKIVLAKFFSAFLMMTIATSVIILYGLVVSTVAEISWATLLGGILGTLLLGGALIAIGLFISSLTESQVVSAVITFAISLLILLMDQLSTGTTSFFNSLIDWFSFNSRYSPFMMGIFDYSNLVYFVSIMAVFIFFTVRKLENKRWQ